MTTATVFMIEAGTALEQHELSAYWPPIDPETFREMIDDARDNGIDTPITMFESKVLDGWHRYNVCAMLGIDCPAVEYEGDDPAGFVIRSNKLRRHSTPGERAEAVLKCRNWAPSGRPRRSQQSEQPAPERPRTNTEIARESQASVSTVTRARRRMREDNDDAPPAREHAPAEPRQVRVNNYPPADSAPDPFDETGPIDDWQDFPDFAAPESSDDSNESDQDSDEQEPEPIALQPPARQTVKQRAEAMRVEDLLTELDDLRQKVAFYESDDNARALTLDNLQLENRSLRSELAELTAQREAGEREINALRRRVQELEANE